MNRNMKAMKFIVFGVCESIGGLVFFGVGQKCKEIL